MDPPEGTARVRTFLIDTDTASDDAVAILMALRDPQVRVAAITTVAGNVSVDKATRNALFVAELCGSDVPVYRGCSRPLLREPTWAYFFHGDDGLGDMGYPAPRRGPEREHGVDALIRHIRESAGDVVLVTLGPLTNLAAALTKDPEIASSVSRCVVMGGAANAVGNITPAAEFNVYVDPEAAAIVLRSGLPLELVGWELCRGEANLDDREMEMVRGLDGEIGPFVVDCNVAAIKANREWLGDPGLGLPDPVAMAVALDASIATRTSAHHVAVETHGELTRGMTVVDALGVTEQEPNVRVCWEIDVPRWKELLYRAVRGA
jgi:purine nucleosidase